MCHVQPPSHLPVVGRPLKLHGQPKSQLHATSTFPLACQLSAAALTSSLSRSVAEDGRDRVGEAAEREPLDDDPRRHLRARISPSRFVATIRCCSGGGGGRSTRS